MNGNTIYTRPEISVHTNMIVEDDIYNKESTLLQTTTASATKIKSEWKPFELHSNKATTRGTFFHECMALPYPFQESDIQALSKQKGWPIHQTDLDQLLALNENEVYQSWMQCKHTLEYPYIVQEESQVIHGFMDLVVWQDNTIHIVDYKTDRVENEQELMDRYRPQLKTYSKSLQKIYPKKIYKCGSIPLL